MSDFEDLATNIINTKRPPLAGRQSGFCFE